MLTQSAEYALRAVVHLAALGPGGQAGASELAAALGVPSNYLSKLLHRLAQEGVLESHRGRRGGYRLAAPAEVMVLAEVLTPFGILPDEPACLLGGGACSSRTPCAAHERWQPIAATVRAFFSATTVAQLASRPAGGAAPRRAEGAR